MRTRYCYLCDQKFQNNRAPDEYIEMTCLEAGHKDCRDNFFVKLSNRLRGYQPQPPQQQGR